MPYKNNISIKKYDNLPKFVDVDDSSGRSVPVNMNFIEEGYLTKDTGFVFVSPEDTLKRHSLYHYKKKDGTSFIISAYDTKLQKLDTTAGTWSDLTSDTWVADKEFGFYVYDDILYGCNGVDDYFKFDGTALTKITSAPKGNVLEVFEDRMFVTGVSTEPMNYYYSDVGDPTAFGATSLVKPLGTDKAITMKNYYGVLMMFKENSIWKLTFVYDQVVALFIPKIELQSREYGACSKDAVTWVGNDLWFFTGRDVKAIGYIDQQTGVFGVNNSVISDQIKHTLGSIDRDNYSKVKVFYDDKKFYLSVAIDSTYNNVLFVCHLLYKRVWTKYTGRYKSRVNSIIIVDGDIYNTTGYAPFRTIKWTSSLNDDTEAIKSEVLFSRIEDALFNKFLVYRYLDVKLKDLTATLKITIKAEANDNTYKTLKESYIGFADEGMENALGEVPTAQYLVSDSFGEVVSNSPFIKKRVSFLSKSQALLVGFSNDRKDETFVLSAFELYGYDQPYKTFSAKKIISIK